MDLGAGAPNVGVLTASDFLVVLMFAVNLITIIGAFGKGISVLISVRDEIRDLKRHVGSTYPPAGLLGDMQAMRKEVLHHRDTLIEVAAELGLKHPGGRT